MPRLGILVATLACLAATGAALLVDMPDVAGALRDLTHSLGPWTYAIVAVLVLVETVAVLGLLSPGEAVLAVGGAAAPHGAVELPVIIAAVWAAAVVGDATGFGLGRRHGRALLVRRPPDRPLRAPARAARAPDPPTASRGFRSATRRRRR